MGFLAIIILAALLWFSDTKLGKALSYFGGVILIIAVIIVFFQYLTAGFQVLLETVFGFLIKNDFSSSWGNVSRPRTFQLAKMLNS